MVALGLHFSLDSVEGVADDCVCAAVEDACDGCAAKLLLPIRALLAV